MEQNNVRMEACGIAMLVVAIMAALALFSFNPADVDPAGIAAATGRTENLIGPVGAYSANLLLEFIGAGTLILVVTLAVFGVIFLLGKKSRIGFREVAGYVIFLLSALTLFHLMLPGRTLAGHPTGGKCGQWTGEILTSLFSVTGAVILTVGILLIALILASNLSLVNGLTNAWRFLGNFFTRTLPNLFRSGNEDLSVAKINADGSGALATAAANRRSTEALVAGAGNSAGAAVVLESVAGKSIDMGINDQGWSFEGMEDSGNDLDAESEQKVVGKKGLKSIFTIRRNKEKKKNKAKGRSNGEGDGTDEEFWAALSSSGGGGGAGTSKKASKATAASAAASSDSDLKTIVPSYSLPDVAILDSPPDSQFIVDERELQETGRKLEEKLADYGVTGKVVAIKPGPVITMFEFQPTSGIKISKIAGLSDDLAMALAAVRVRIVAPIPGRPVVGIEVPNAHRETVYLREMLASQAFVKSKARLPLALGKDIVGNAIIEDLAKMPHLLVAGSTGSGKSVAVNGMLISLLYKYGPEELRLILVDPKMLEFSMYDGIPHLLLPVVTDPKKAAIALKWAVDEMERRYAKMAEVGVRSLLDYNRWAEKRQKEKNKAVDTGEDALATSNLAATDMLRADDLNGTELGEYNTGDHAKSYDDDKPFPYIVVVIDEFCDLMMVAPKDVEHAVMRLAQKARAAGLHVVLATQRPSVDVITGTIKANFPSRMAFRVAQKEDSRTVLGTNGAENLLGNGDMLFLRAGANLERLHGPFVSDDEVKAVVKFLKTQGAPDYDLDILKVPDEDGQESATSGNGDDYDELWDEAIAIVAERRIASASMLQRRLSIGFNRAARMIEVMEKEGIVGPGDGAKPREVLIPPVP